MRAGDGRKRDHFVSGAISFGKRRSDDTVIEGALAFVRDTRNLSGR